MRTLKYRYLFGLVVACLAAAVMLGGPVSASEDTALGALRGGDDPKECVTSTDTCPSLYTGAGFCGGGAGTACISCGIWQQYQQTCTGSLGACINDPLIDCAASYAGTCVRKPGPPVHFVCSPAGAAIGLCGGPNGTKITRCH